MDFAGASAPVSPQAWNAASGGATPGRRTALVLSGGIAQGCYQAGVMKSLAARGYRFDVICGTSIGALNGAFMAQGDMALLERVWKSVGSQPIKRYERHVRHVANAVADFTGTSINPIRRYVLPIVELYVAYDGGAIERVQGAYDPAGAQAVLQPLDLRRVQIPFAFAVTNVSLGRAEALYARPPETAFRERALTSIPFTELDPANAAHVAVYAEAVRASGALPLAFPPVPLPGLNASSTPDAPQVYADGGVANNTPVRLARKLGVTDMLCVFMSPRVTAPAPVDVRTVVDALLNLYTANQAQLLDDEILLAIQTRESLRLRQIADAATVNPVDRLVNIYEIRPARDIGVGPLAFDDQRQLDAGFALGEADGRNDPTPYPPVPYPVI